MLQSSVSVSAFGSAEGSQPGWQICSAAITQSESHAVLQHDGSTVHTALQHARSLQAPDACGEKQLPAVGVPHTPGVPGHANPAYCVQVKSQDSLQQNGSNAQTAVQQAALSQFGFLCGEKQEPLAVAPGYPTQFWLATSTHAASQPPTPQQEGSRSQTRVQHARLLQPGVGWIARQDAVLLQICALASGENARAAATSEPTMPRVGLGSKG